MRRRGRNVENFLCLGQALRSQVVPHQVQIRFHIGVEVAPDLIHWNREDRCWIVARGSIEDEDVGLGDLGADFTEY